ncbi:MAG TPA: hypothetical protein PKL88_01430 [bacterium]|nr:hypothetical protein [bacterium]
MNKKFIALGSVGLLFGGLMLFTNKASAYKGDPTIKGPNYTEERHEEMTKAFENNDYNAWKNLMSGRGRVLQVINEENFARFAEARRLALEGKTEEAAKIRQELGLGLQNGSGKGMGQGLGGCETCERNFNR